jgi:O-methyltransferase involved in polyketide biosynthesis
MNNILSSVPDVSSTMLITLYARAGESISQNPIIQKIYVYFKYILPLC